MRHIYPFMLVTALGLAAWPGVGRAPAAELPERAKECWKTYEQRVRQTTGTFEDKTLRNGKEDDHNRTDVVGTSQYRLYTRQLLKFSGQDRRSDFVYGVNPAYTFAIKRKTSDVPWEILTLASAANDADYRAALAKTDSAVQLLLAPVMIRDTPLTQLFAEPGLRILSMSEGTKGDQPTWQVRFACPHPYRAMPPGYMPVQGGELTFTRDHWLLLGYTADALHPGPIRLTAEFEYAGLPGPDPLPVKVTQRAEFAAFEKDPPLVVDDVKTYNLAPTAGRPDPDRFRLTAYGLTEPAGVANLFPLPWYTRWYVWTLTAAAALIAAGWYLGRPRRPKG